MTFLYRLLLPFLFLLVGPISTPEDTPEEKSTLNELNLTDLSDDGGVYRVDFNGSYQDFLIPDDPSTKIITFYLEGGDGGGRNSCNGAADGGKGGEIEVSFPIGTGDYELKPGGVIRFIVGERGQNNNTEEGGGGGFSGGGGGNKGNGAGNNGGGGGSFVNENYAIEGTFVINGGGDTGNPQNGHITYQFPLLAANSNEVCIDFNGTARDFIIPEDLDLATLDGISFLMRGADGGRVTRIDPGIITSKERANGGRGALVSVDLEIGTQAGQLQRGGDPTFYSWRKRK